jgi:WD40 repeat protein
MIIKKYKIYFYNGFLIVLFLLINFFDIGHLYSERLLQIDIIDKSLAGDLSTDTDNLYKGAKDKCFFSHERRGAVRKIAFSSDTQCIITERAHLLGADWGEMFIWNIKSGKILSDKSLEWDNLLICKPSVVLITKREKSVDLKYIPYNEKKTLFLKGEIKYPIPLAISNNERTMVGYPIGPPSLESTQKQLFIWDMKNGQKIDEFKVVDSDILPTLQFSPDEKYIYISHFVQKNKEDPKKYSSESYLTARDFMNGKDIFNVSIKNTSHPINTIVCSSDGKYVCAFDEEGHEGIFEGIIMIYDALSGKLLQKNKIDSSIWCAIALAGKGSVLMLGCEDSSIRLFDIEKGHIIKKISFAHGIVTSLAISKDEKLIACGFEDGVAEVLSMPKIVSR